jgi:hypothetical protein
MSRTNSSLLSFDSDNDDNEHDSVGGARAQNLVDRATAIASVRLLNTS